MRTKLYFFALGLIGCILPVTVQGAILLDKEGGSGGGPMVQSKRMSVPLVKIDVESGLIGLSFNFNLGEVQMELQDATGTTVLCESIDTSVQNQALFGISAGTYTLTVVTGDGMTVTTATIIIP